MKTQRQRHRQGQRQYALNVTKGGAFAALSTQSVKNIQASTAEDSAQQPGGAAEWPPSAALWEQHTVWRSNGPVAQAPCTAGVLQ